MPGTPAAIPQRLPHPDPHQPPSTLAGVNARGGHAPPPRALVAQMSPRNRIRYSESDSTVILVRRGWYSGGP